MLRGTLGLAPLGLQFGDVAGSPHCQATPWSLESEDLVMGSKHRYTFKTRQVKLMCSQGWEAVF